MIIGSPITADEVSSYPQYNGQTITPLILSQVAMLEINRSEGTQGDIQQAAIKTVNSMKEEYGNGISTLILIYNASGEAITYQADHDYHGHIWKYPYDQTIQNGQWSIVLHVHSSGAALGSEAAVVYRTNSQLNDLFLGWETPYSKVNKTIVRCKEANHWPGVDSWDDMKQKLDAATTFSEDTQWSTFDLTSSTGANSSPQLVCTIKRTA